MAAISVAISGSHRVAIEREARPGMRDAEFRVSCVCGWVEKAHDEHRAQGHADHHLSTNTHGGAR